MTSAARAGRWISEHERFRREGGELLTVRISPSGKVIFHCVAVQAVNVRPGETFLWPTYSTMISLGQVDPDDPAWLHRATQLMADHGLALADDWTTVARWPAARAVRIRKTSPGAVPGGN